MSWPFKRRVAKRRDEPGEAVGIFLFDDVSAAIKAEAVLRRADYEVELVSPPPHLRAGCDLAVAVPVVERLGAERALVEGGAHARGWSDSLEGTMELADIVTTEDFGQWLMVRAGNMKITVEKATGTIVNTSGGGCPDIPYLNLEFVGANLADGRRPKDVGFTLCGLMLDRAFVEAGRLLGGAAAGEAPKVRP
ncbi:MAG TPA: DUF3343 domain-containing protein [Coriobacteriia bacterium]|nr:DUF3343 domain-containing protein [Coriobacteriia bacterium]